MIGCCSSSNIPAPKKQKSRFSKFGCCVDFDCHVVIDGCMLHGCPGSRIQNIHHCCYRMDGIIGIGIGIGIDVHTQKYRDTYSSTYTCTYTYVEEDDLSRSDVTNAGIGS